jgi:ABC-type transport system involved in multi-copper enzyme maturation permease subunit
MLWRNPVFQREFVSGLRSRRATVLALVGILSLTAVLFVFWPRTGVFSHVNTTELFSIFLGTELGLMLLLTPGFTAGAITGERERGAFQLLFMSLLRPHDILLGKLFACLGIPLLLLLCVLPVSAICALSGGISPGLLVRAHVVIVAAIVAYGMVGLAVSSLCSRTFTSLVSTYVAVILLAGAGWVPSVLLNHMTGMRRLWQTLRCLSPFEALFALNYAASYDVRPGALDSGAVFLLYLRQMGLLALAGLVVFCFFVLRPPRSGRRGLDREPGSDGAAARKRKLGFPFHLVDRLRRKRSIPPYRNPVFVAELRSKVFGHPKVIFRILAVCLAISLGLLTIIARQYATVLDPDEVRCLAVVFQVGLMAFLAPAVSSGAITDEVASGTLVLLRVSPLSPWRVVVGKLEAAFLYVTVFLLSSLPVLFALAYLESEAGYWRVAAWVGLLVITTVALVSVGLCASTFAASTPVATAVSYGVAAFLCVGTLGVLLPGERLSASVKASVLTLNPLVAALQVTSDTWFADQPLILGQPLWQVSFAALGLLSVALLAVTVVRVRSLFRVQD